MAESSRDSIRPDSASAVPRYRWATTQWSLVCQAGQRGEGAAEAAEALCRAYWFPVYAFIRRSGTRSLEAADVTQGFFLSLLEGGDLSKPDPSRGRFRTWLRTAAHNYLRNQIKHSRAKKRGGDKKTFSFDAACAEAWLQQEPHSAELTPDELYDRVFAGRVIERAVGRLRQHYAERGQAELLAQLIANLGAGEEPLTDAQLGLLLGKTAAAVKQARFHVRGEFAELSRALKTCIRDEVASTVLLPARVDAELRDLLQVLDGGRG